MDGINTYKRYEAAMSEFIQANAEDKKMAWQLLEMFAIEKASVCRAKIILKLAYDFLDVQSLVLIAPPDSEQDSPTTSEELIDIERMVSTHGDISSR